ncbi:hypothetical protein C2G38_2195631 [Gigaspora rosea]|uniref:histidine kinase n=1 Tax=Gigaspora rosea TaxID=44941 RepID=A0A397UYK0_9GLOM|nr:hypothetical protein C2G38_2195631 [Gigaspora rosea]
MKLQSKEISLGPLLLHDNKIIHRDLITDFDLSKQINETSMTSNTIIHGIPAYIEPQCLIERGYKYDKTSDIYSFGKSFGKFQTSPKPSFKYTPNVKKCRTVVGSSAKETISTPQIMFQQSKVDAVRNNTTLISLDLDDNRLKKSSIETALGKSSKETWAGIYDIIDPLFDGPVFKSDGTVCALIAIVQETTQKVLNTRRLKILNDFGRRMPEIESLEKACCITTEVLSNNKDIPYAIVYFVEPRSSVGSKSIIARLVSTTFDEDDKKEYVNRSYDKYITLKRHVATYSFVKCDESWPLDLVIKDGKHVKVLLKDGSQAILLLANSFCGNQELSAILICGINRLRTLDENKSNEYMFTTRKDKRRGKKRAKILADLNFQKVSFFQGISHELKKLASDFKNIAKKLGLVYNIDIPSPEEFNKAAGDKIYLDHDMYETILYNLCSNALKHTWNGHISIRLYLDYKDNKKIVLEVSDTGVGIPEAVLPNIFRRFYRVESQGSRSHEGTGIGLALVKELITRHGGDITVTSVINQGTTFKCWFPVGSLFRTYSISEVQDDIMDQVSIEDQMLINNQNMNINIMDQVSTKDQMSIDNQNLNVNIVNTSEKCDYLTDLLKKLDVHHARDGKDALRVLKKLNKLPDLILSGNENSIIRGLNKGADDYLTKPFSARDLITRIRININLSLLRRKIIFQQCKQEEIKQLLLTISEKLASKLDLDGTLQDVAKRLYQILPCEKILIISNKKFESKSNRIVALFEDPEKITNSSSEIDDNYESESQTFCDIQEFLKNNPGIVISLDMYFDDIFKNASILSAEIKLNNDIWGWIKAYSPSNSIWLVSEIELLQQISNQIILAINHNNLLDESAEKNIEIKAAEAANIAKSQMLANASHELRTPLGAIVDILEGTIEKYGKKANDKKVELILNCDVDVVSRYVKSDPERVKFTDKGEIVLTISIQSREFIDENGGSPTYGQILKKENLLFELYDTEKRILVIHRVESMRIKKVDAFDTFDKGISAAKRYSVLYNKPAYDIAFIDLYEDNEADVMKAILELRGLEIDHNNIFSISK